MKKLVTGRIFTAQFRSAASGQRGKDWRPDWYDDSCTFLRMRAPASAYFSDLLAVFPEIVANEEAREVVG
jgi:hypothetical protein